MSRLLIICGPTATGKTSFSLDVAKRFNGELVSADSRQVYIGMDVVTGKDLPPNLKPETSSLVWKNRALKFYLFDGIKVWLYDVVSPDESFNVSFWKNCADLVISDILSRGKLPIVVGGTGLYIKSLVQPLSQIDTPPNPKIRSRLQGKSAEYLFKYLTQLNPFSSARINRSDRSNPRRLIRAIEITLFKDKALPPLELRGGLGGRYDEELDHLTIGLTAPKAYLNSRIDQRVDERITSGAITEAKRMLDKYSLELPSMTSSGYRAFLYPDSITKWKILEHQYARRQLTWFKTQPDIHWFDISTSSWRLQADELVENWYTQN